jgi:hypothetical protein
VKQENTTKKAYRAPVLVEYGSMETLTRGPWGGFIDQYIGRNGDGWNPFLPRSGRSG